jgi:hypothetical protein
MNFNLNSANQPDFNLCKNIFVTALRNFGSSLTPDTEKSFDSLIKTMDKGFRGSLESSFYLSPIDTGLDKSLCIKSYIKALIISGNINKAGILICLQTKAEIKTFIDDCGLDNNLFAVLVSNDPLNDKGRGERGRDEAPILFTTHAMIRSRSGVSFLDAKDFFYQGKPRNLRLWDESLLPAEPVSFSIDTLASIAAPLRPHEPQFVKELDFFLNGVVWKTVGELVMVPESLCTWAGDITANEGKGFKKLNDKQIAVLDQIAQSAEKELTVSQSRTTGKALSGIVSELPTDISPAIIFDASGRLKATYELWEKHRGNLVRLPSATNDYSNVTINLWKTKAGRDALEDEETGRTIFKEVAKLIAAKPDEKWLMVSFKADAKLDVLNEVHSYLSEEISAAVKLDYVHWGRHCAINDYADTKNVIIIGSWFYSSIAYRALYQAAAGEPVGENETEAIGRMKRTEFQANFLQAFMRGHGRRSINSKAGECTAYVVASNSPNPTPLIANALPGCTINEWSPVPVGWSGQAKAIADYLLAQRAAGVRTIAKNALGKAVGIVHKQQLSKLFRSDRFKQWLQDSGIKMNLRNFVLIS